MLKDLFRKKSAPLTLERDMAAYEQRFLANRDENLFMGSFQSFEDAASNAPSTKALGYDNSDAASSLYSHHICSWDYAGLYWVTDAVNSGAKKIFDLGGHVGIKYYAFKRVLKYPSELCWTVCDVPAVAAAGALLAEQRNVDSQLKFSTDFRQATGTDLLFLSGSLQYIPVQLESILSTLAKKPKRVVLNVTATHPSKTLYTLNSIGVAVCPYRIQHQDEILKELRSAGYRRRDVWRTDGKEIRIPFVEGGNDPYYFGCCFDHE